MRRPQYHIPVASRRVDLGVQSPMAMAYVTRSEFSLPLLNPFCLISFIQANSGKKLGTSANCTPADMDPVFLCLRKDNQTRPEMPRPEILFTYSEEPDLARGTYLLRK